MALYTTYVSLRCFFLYQRFQFTSLVEPSGDRTVVKGNICAYKSGNDEIEKNILRMHIIADVYDLITFS